MLTHCTILFVILIALCIPPTEQQGTCTPSSCSFSNLPSPNPKQGVATNVFRVGLVEGTPSDITAITMARFAAYLINNNASFLPNVSFEVYTVTASTRTATFASTIALFQLANVSALIVDIPEENTFNTAEVVAAYKKPVISMNSITESFVTKTTAPTLFRMSSPNNCQLEGVLEVLRYLSKNTTIYIYTSDTYGTAALDMFTRVATLKNVTVFPIAIDAAGRALTTVATSVRRRVGVNWNNFVVNVNANQAVTLMRNLNTGGYVGPNYLYILSASVTVGFADSPYLSLLDGAIALRPRQFDIAAQEYVSFISRWNAANATLFPGPRPTPSEGFYAFESVYTYAYAIANVMAATSTYPATDSNRYLNFIRNVSFAGVSGPVSFDANGDRVGDYVILNYLGPNSTATGYYFGNTNSLKFIRNFTFFNGTTTIPTVTNATTIRPNSFYCGIIQRAANTTGLSILVTGTIDPNNATNCICYKGYSGARCDTIVLESSSSSLSTTTIIAIIVPTVFVLIATLVAAFFYYRRRRTQLVQDVALRQRSQINKGDLKLQDRIGRGASGEVFKALFRGTEVAVKRLVATNTNKSAVEEFMLETAIMCGLRHPNIVLFMGSCFDTEAKEMLLVMEFHSKGSLHDVLHNPKLSLPLELQIHIAYQAAQGMNFLHESNPAIIHRDMKSHNILLDDKWNARISDFGITKIKDTHKGKGEGTQAKSQSVGTIFWTAPEVLDGHQHTEKSDCYSFGIVLWEIFHRMEPYVGKDPMAVAIDVLNKQLRPTIDPRVPVELHDLMVDCWAQDPLKRPTFMVIMDRLRALVMQHPVYNFGAQSASRNEAPTGNLILVATQIESLFTMWDAAPRALQESLTMHNHLLRSSLELYGGYEARFENFEFLLAFPTLEKALNWSISVQVSLLNVAWPHEILETPWAKEELSLTGQPYWRGLRVRMCVHMGAPTCELDSSSNRMNYRGPVVDRLHQLQKIAGSGICVSPPVMEEIDRKNTKLIEGILARRGGENGADAHNYIIPESLAMRSPMQGATSAELLNYASPLEELELTDNPTPQKEEVDWVVGWGDMAVKENIGKGPIGDFYRAVFEKKDVAIKVLVNQKLKEDDMIRLIGDAAVLSKVSHKNLLGFRGLCIEPTHICLVTEYVPNGNLRAALNNPLVSLPHPRKLKLAHDIANGLAYLAQHPDHDLRIHDNLKSNNVMITKDWEVKVTDFGQSNVKDLARTMTSVSNVAWTAPEILTGEPISVKSSVYSFGIIMWEILTRTTPYENEHPIKIVTKILSGRRPIIPKDCPNDYRQLMESCWSAESEMRPSWNVVASELSHMMESNPL